ncbi:MAG: dihydrofolate reductase family protein [Chitinispirillaceae bacterium]|nr:dihydrofolate reductase family protein [Chitinispirillaceae bacterium]
MTCSVFTATSIDGFIARIDGSLDWLTQHNNGAAGDCGYDSFLRTVDAIVMGRATFEFVSGLNEWPYSLPVFVLSSTIGSLSPVWDGRASVVNESPNILVTSLAERGFKHLYIDGGKTVSSFLQDDLIDTIIITTVPVLLGTGVPLFSGDRPEQRFERVRTEVFGAVLVTTTYRRIRRSENGKQRR